jgi:hypothetical protein
MEIEKYISPLIASQFPSFYRDEGPNFIAFVKAYYEWMEQTNGITERSRSLLNYFDIDNTEEEFIKYFKSTYISSLPESIIADKRLLVKHILELYRSKGTKRAYELLFRLLFNEDITVDTPGNYIFKPSDGTWVIPQYIEVSDSEYLQYFVGKQIYTATATAIVENYVIKNVNNKVLNILNLSNIKGSLRFDQQIFCDDLYVNNTTGAIIDTYQYVRLSSADQSNYSKAINDFNAPVIFGSLSTISIINGGANYNVGDLLSVNGDGVGGIARVAATRKESGKVTFTLVDGGFGYTINSIVTVSGSGGTGASFTVGDITNKEIYVITSDQIDGTPLSNDYRSTQLDNTNEGFDITVDTKSGPFSINEQVSSTANSVTIDVSIVDGFISNNNIISNTSLGINNLLAYRSEASFITITGADSDITNANLATGVILNNGSGGSVKINTIFPKETITGTANVVSDSGSVVSVNNFDGYFVSGSILTGGTSGATANVSSVFRNTLWGFPKLLGGGNLDTIIPDTLITYDLEVGTITYLSQINPGVGYSSNPTVTVVEPAILGFMILDGKGNYYGNNAIVNAKSGNANGIVTAIEVYDSGLGYNFDKVVTMNSTNNLVSVTGISIIDQNGKGSGYLQDKKGLPSNKSYIQDSYYYQTFSYEIVAKRMLDTYEKVVKDLIHPSGLLLFGRYVNSNELSENVSQIELSSLSQS